MGNCCHLEWSSGSSSRIYLIPGHLRHSYIFSDRRISCRWMTVFSVQLLSCVWLVGTPWTVAHQASLSITNSQSLLKLMFIELVMPSNHLILCHPLLLLPSIFNQGLFQWVRSLHQVAKVLQFLLQHQSFHWIFRTVFRHSITCFRDISP